jgi:hypothetical protein
MAVALNCDAYVWALNSTTARLPSASGAAYTLHTGDTHPAVVATVGGVSRSVCGGWQNQRPCPPSCRTHRLGPFRHTRSPATYSGSWLMAITSTACSTAFTAGVALRMSVPMMSGDLNRAHSANCAAFSLSDKPLPTCATAGAGVVHLRLPPPPPPLPLPHLEHVEVVPPARASITGQPLRVAHQAEHGVPRGRDVVVNAPVAVPV